MEKGQGAGTGGVEGKTQRGQGRRGEEGREGGRGEGRSEIGRGEGRDRRGPARTASRGWAACGTRGGGSRRRARLLLGRRPEQAPQHDQTALQRDRPKVQAGETQVKGYNDLIQKGPEK